MNIEAQRLLHQYGQKGNWRFKGLLLAALPSTRVSVRDVAEAWPTKPGDYRFLQGNPDWSPEQAAKEQVSVQKGTENHAYLSQYAGDALKEGPHDLASARLDEAIQHALFAVSTPEELDTLFRKEISDVVADGARRRQMARDAAFVFNASTIQGEVPVGEDGSYNYTDAGGGHAEGAIIPDDAEEFSTVSWSCNKIGVGARITDEMIDHAVIDIIERQIRWIGEVTENDINRIWLNNLVDNAGQDHDTAGSNQDLSALNSAAGVVDGQDFMPDSFATHPEFRTKLFDDSNLVFVQRSGRDMELRQRELDTVLGVTHYPFSNSTHDTSSTTWGFAADGEKGAVVYQRDHAWLIIHKDIQIKDYEDPIRDLQGVNTRAWVDAKLSQTNAACTIQF